ncbi:hypothetical protein [Microbacterium sp.]|uniref:hypothetical protein n=1 Tax=Microbacterium sp. TaxID=51671 RepID=UPI003A858EFE
MSSLIEAVQDLPASVLVPAAFTLVGTVIGLWIRRRREKRGELGPGVRDTILEPLGYLPADLRHGVAPTPTRSAEDRWLLGLAAPFVEGAGMLHDRWSLVPARTNAAWNRHLREVATRRGVVNSRDWKRQVKRFEIGLADIPGSAEGDPLRAWEVAHLAITLRLGVALRHTTARSARARLAAAAAPMRTRFADWYRFGDAFVQAAEWLLPGRTYDLRADTRLLYAEGGPWHDPAWPQ